VIRYILKQDIPSSLEDALKVAQGYRLSDDEIYSLRIIDLIDREQVWSFRLCGGGCFADSIFMKLNCPSYCHQTKSRSSISMEALQ
jgi:hypothetical protein